MSDAETERRDGRGRLSSIDMLPDAAEPDIVWALDQLQKRDKPQTAILNEFNGRLADRGVASVSKSAFSRWAIRKSIQLRRLMEVRTITADIVTGLGTDGADQVTVAVAEMLKVAIYEMLESRKGIDPKGLAEMGKALSAAVSAQKGSVEYRQKLEARARAMIDQAMDKAEKAVTEAGLGADRIREMKAEFLGLQL